MNSDEIDRFLRRRLRDFDGVFGVDNMPEDPHLLVCNTDTSDKPGRHWIVIYIENGAETFSTRLSVDLMLILNVIWIVTVRRGTLMINSYRV